ncbi:MAG: DUF427 domain-containing protein [Pseudomonadota bacterium]
MTDHIKIHPAQGTWVVRGGGAIIAESTAALELVEGRYPPVVYFPRKDVAMAFLEPSDRTSTCPHKGAATYFSITSPDGSVEDAAWSYESPVDAVGAIAGHLAFYADRVSVEKL